MKGEDKGIPPILRQGESRHGRVARRENENEQRGVYTQVRERVADGGFRPDAEQIRLAKRLDDLARGLHAYTRPSLLGRLVSRFAPAAPKGLYIYGAVGRGKTALLDLFFDSLQIHHKRRIHFVPFMEDVHRRLFTARQSQGSEDPLLLVAKSLATEFDLLCLDEFLVEDVADAMILGRLFSVLFEHGVVLVATSNCPLERLYEDGLNRGLFLPFIDMMKTTIEEFRLSSPEDYRRAGTKARKLSFFLDEDGGTLAMQELWETVASTPLDETSGCDLSVGDRILSVPKANGGFAWFGYAALLERPLGGTDYLQLAERFKGLFIDGIPQFARGQSAARRMIALVDVYYDAGRMLVLSADAPIDSLFGDVDFPGVARARSRLTEMQSERYARRSGFVPDLWGEPS